MEENIKWLKEWIERDRDIRKNSIESDFDKFCERNCEAIENVLVRLEQDEKLIKVMAKELRIRQYNCYGKSIKTIIDHFRKKCE